MRSIVKNGRECECFKLKREENGKRPANQLLLNFSFWYALPLFFFGFLKSNVSPCACSRCVVCEFLYVLNGVMYFKLAHFQRTNDNEWIHRWIGQLNSLKPQHNINVCVLIFFSNFYWWMSVLCTVFFRVYLRSQFYIFRCKTELEEKYGKRNVWMRMKWNEMKWINLWYFLLYWSKFQVIKRQNV